MPSSQALPSVFFNHVFNVLDPETGMAVRESDFIKKEFAAYSESTVKADHGDSWSGMYLMGRGTYVELLAPAGKEFKRGDWGVGLSVEVPRGVDLCFRALRGKVGRRRVVRVLRKRLMEGRLVPWYRAVELRPYVGTWIFEYLPEYMDAYKGPALRKGDELSRERYNRPLYDKNKPFADVTGVTLALGKANGTALSSTLKALGYTVEGPRSKRVCLGPGIKIVILPAGRSRDGLKAITMGLRKDLGAKKLNLGNSKLSLDGKRATWNF